MRTQLTKRIVATAQPKERPYELRDTLIRGLILRVQPSGHKAWIVSWAHGKRRTLGALGHLTLDQARAHASQAMAEHIQRGLPSIAKKERARCSLAGFLSDRYAPWAVAHLRRGQQWVDRIEAAFADALPRDVSEIDAAWVDQWWLKRIAAVSRATASRDLACLRAAMNKAVRWGVLDRSPLADLQLRPVESRHVVRFLNQAEERKLRKALTDRDAAMVAARESGNGWRMARGKPLLPEIDARGFGDHLTPLVLLAMNTGLRRGELLSLRWSDVDLEARVLTVRAENAKTGRERHVPLNSEALNVLKTWAMRGRGREVFGIGDVKTAWAALLQAAGLVNIRFHDLRHHFASRLVMAGIDLNTVRELLGHSDIKMTLRYSHLAPDHLAAAVDKLTR